MRSKLTIFMRQLLKPHCLSDQTYRRLRFRSVATAHRPLSRWGAPLALASFVILSSFHAYANEHRISAIASLSDANLVVAAIDSLNPHSTQNYPVSPTELLGGSAAEHDLLLKPSLAAILERFCLSATGGSSVPNIVDRWQVTAVAPGQPEPVISHDITPRVSSATAPLSAQNQTATLLESVKSAMEEARQGKIALLSMKGSRAVNPSTMIDRSPSSQSPEGDFLHGVFNAHFEYLYAFGQQHRKKEAEVAIQPHLENWQKTRTRSTIGLDTVAAFASTAILFHHKSRNMLVRETKNFPTVVNLQHWNRVDTQLRLGEKTNDVLILSHSTMLHLTPTVHRRDHAKGRTFH